MIDLTEWKGFKVTKGGHTMHIMLENGWDLESAGECLGALGRSGAASSKGAVACCDGSSGADAPRTLFELQWYEHLPLLISTGLETLVSQSLVANIPSCGLPLKASSQAARFLWHPLCWQGTSEGTYWLQTNTGKGSWGQKPVSS